MLRTWLCFALLGAAACADGSGSRGMGTLDDPATDPEDDGAPSDGDDGDDTSSPDDDGSEPDATSGDEAPGDAGLDAEDGGKGGLLDPILEYTTCEPDEINPVVECITVTCPMNLDPVALVSCMLEQCAPLVEAVNPKCRDCITAAIAQDTAGLLQNCLKIDEILPGSGTTTP
jgi:hypothetical protein